LLREQDKQRTDIVYQLHTTINHHFPDLFKWLRVIEDVRKGATEYELATILTVTVQTPSIFLVQQPLSLDNHDMYQIDCLRAEEH